MESGEVNYSYAVFREADHFGASFDVLGTVRKLGGVKKAAVHLQIGINESVLALFYLVVIVVLTAGRRYHIDIRYTGLEHIQQGGKVRGFYPFFRKKQSAG